MSQPVFPQFFLQNTFLIDEKVGLFKFSNAYKVFDNTGEQIGLVQQRISGFHKFLRIIGDIKKMMPFTLEIQDANGQVLATIHRGWTLFMSKIAITDAYDSPIGFIEQKFRFLKPRFLVYDHQQVQVAEIQGDWKAWDFSITNPSGEIIGTISKKWNGFAREAFTTADKYVVNIEERVAEDRTKMAIVSAAITIDMVLKEGK